MAVDPDDMRIVYAGNANRCLYASYDAAENWTVLGEIPASGPINDILIPPHGENVIYVATNRGIFRWDL